VSDEAKVVLITGASSGFGRAIAERLSSTGMIVYGTSRRVTDDGCPYRMIVMDVADEASIGTAVKSIVDREGRIDVVVNNAGVGVAGSIEDTSIEEAKLQFDTNFFGVVRVVQAVLPYMRERRRGRIINISSIGGLIGLPYQAFYSASKFALESLTESLRLELEPFGVDAVAIEPGDFKTGFTNNRIVAKAAAAGPYAKQFGKTLEVYAGDEINGADPELVAELVERVISVPAPKVRYLVGMTSQKAAAVLRRVVGSKLFEGLMRRHCRIG
jgi:NAD(P)-dependent dehydrogenase (short-subunit alcohol dehydrogenase family)